MRYSDFKRIEFEGIRDFDLTHIFECGQVFRWLPEEGSEGSVYTGVCGSYAARVSYEDGSLVIEASGGDRNFWETYFDLGTDYGKIKCELASKEPEIKAALDYGHGIRILNQDIFETLISFIISQNNNIPRIRKCIEALTARYGEPIDEINGVLIHAFPSAAVLAEAKTDDIAELKLGYRSSYIVQSARQYMEKGEPASYEDLISMHGVGPKVANCIRLFGLRDVSAFPIDTWVKQIMHDMYGFDEKDVSGMEKFAREKFDDYAGYAQQYLFYYYRDR